jgi:hypothetical protein
MTRLADAWRAMEGERRLAAVMALGLLVSMFLPWYSKTDTLIVQGAPRSTQTSLNAFQAFSFVEAAVLLVAGGVLVLLFKRAEGLDFRMPGGDGLVVMVAGAWAALLVFYRLLDKPGLQGTQRVTATVGVEWGIFFALLIALGLAYAGRRIHAGERPEAPLTRPRARRRENADARERFAAPAREQPFAAPDEEPFATTEEAPRPAARATRRGGAPVRARERAPYPPAPPEQLSFEDPPAHAD